MMQQTGVLIRTANSNEYRRARSVALVLALTLSALAFSACNVPGEASASGGTDTGAGPGVVTARTPETRLLVPAGTSLHVRLLHTVSSRSSRPGDEFMAELSGPLELGGRVLFARSSRVRGRIVSARPSGRLNRRSHLQLTLDSIEGQDGRWHRVNTTSVSAWGPRHKKRNLTLIGGGTGVGALIGGIASGGVGTLVGAAVGAGAGTAGAAVTGRKEVAFPAERVLTFTLTNRHEFS